MWGGSPTSNYLLLCIGLCLFLISIPILLSNFRYVIQNILPEIPTALVAVPPSTRERGNPKLIHEGRMFANTRETIKFYNAESADWEGIRIYVHMREHSSISIPVDMIKETHFVVE